jgi:hypothetical protein
MINWRYLWQSNCFSRQIPFGILKSRNISENKSWSRLFLFQNVAIAHTNI